jgi:purine-binding chemotaxis protein CheW
MRPFIQFSSRNIQKSNEYYLAFQIGDDCFAANFPKIAGFSKEYQFLPYKGNLPFIAGLATVNNENIPVIDLKNKIGMSSNLCINNGKIIVIETEVHFNTLKFAFLYDTLGDAFELSPKKILPVPNIGKQFTSGSIKGAHVIENQCIMLIDLDKVFSIDDLIDIKVTYPEKVKKLVSF